LVAAFILSLPAGLVTRLACRLGKGNPATTRLDAEMLRPNYETNPMQLL
jgi:hypothetical protein